MNTLSLESLLITEEEWVATEGFGSMVKKAGGYIWDKVVHYATTLAEKISTLIKKLKNMVTHRSRTIQNAKEGKARIQSIARIRYKLMDELQSVSRGTLNHVESALDYISVKSNDQDALKDRLDKYEGPIIEDSAQISNILKKYPEVRALPKSEIEEGIGTISNLDKMVTEDIAVLESLQKDVINLLIWGKNIKKRFESVNNELPKEASSLLHKAEVCATALLNADTKALTYCYHEAYLIHKGYETIEKFSNK